MKIINQTRILFEYFGNIKNPERWVRIGYPNIRMPNKPFHDRSLAGFSPEVAAMEAPAAAAGGGRRRADGEGRVGEGEGGGSHIPGRPVHLQSSSLHAAVVSFPRLFFSFGCSPFLFDLRLYGRWLVERSLVTPCAEKESIFFLFVLFSHQIMYFMNLIQYHIME